jgi:hypothetical protein
MKEAANLRGLGAGALCLALASCGRADQPSEARNISAQIGRYQFIAAKEPYPAMIFDTVTGCPQALYVLNQGKSAGSVQIAGVVGQQACTAVPVAKYKVIN